MNELLVSRLIPYTLDNATFPYATTPTRLHTHAPTHPTQIKRPHATRTPTRTPTRQSLSSSVRMDALSASKLTRRCETIVSCVRHEDTAENPPSDRASDGSNGSDPAGNDP